MARRVTLKDVAREAGMSESAVSQVLNGRPCRLSEESKRRIRACAERMDYRPNRAARGLVTRRSGTIGLIVPDIENPFFSSLAKSFEARCQDDGLGLFITNSNDRLDHDCEQLRRLDALGVDGIVFVPSNEILGEGEKDIMDVLSGLSVPYVMVDRIIEGAECDKVFVDNEYGAHQAVEHLISFGHARIGCLANTRSSQNGRLRLAGYENALADHGIAVDPALICEGDYHGASGYRAVDELVAAGATAIFSTSDLMTIGVMRRLSELCLSVPGDISVVSFDRNEASAFFLPNITSVKQDVGQLSACAFDLLAERIAGSAGAPRLRVIEPTLVEGQSVSAPVAPASVH